MNTREKHHWYSVADAAQYLGMTERQVRRALASKKIAHTKLGGLRVYFSREQLDAYVAACTVQVAIPQRDEA